MKLPLACFLLGVSVVGYVGIVFAQSNSAVELNLGVQSYKEARFDDAIEHFQRAIASDSSNVRAHLYLATTYAQQYIPGAETPDNTRVGSAAVREYEKVLEQDPSNLNAIKGIAYLRLQMKQFEQAKQAYQRAIDLEPNDPESYYSIGVIDWTQAYQPRMEARAKLNMKPEDSLVGMGQCEEIKDQNRVVVADGIERLKSALERRPDYDDAMAYMNLMYRERADIQCGDSKAEAADLKTADEWVDLTMATKKAKAQKRPAEKMPDPR